MLKLRDELSKHAESSGVAKHYKSDQFVLIVRAYKVLSKEIPRELAFDSLEILTVMPETSPLTNWRFIEGVCHSQNKVVVILCLSHFDADFLAFADHISSSPLCLLGPPVIETLN